MWDYMECIDQGYLSYLYWKSDEVKTNFLPNESIRVFDWGDYWTKGD